MTKRQRIKVQILNMLFRSSVEFARVIRRAEADRMVHERASEDEYWRSYITNITERSLKLLIGKAYNEYKDEMRSRAIRQDPGARLDSIFI